GRKGGSAAGGGVGLRGRSVTCHRSPKFGPWRAAYSTAIELRAPTVAATTTVASQISGLSAWGGSRSAKLSPGRGVRKRFTMSLLPPNDNCTNLDLLVSCH